MRSIRKMRNGNTNYDVRFKRKRGTWVVCILYKYTCSIRIIASNVLRSDIVNKCIYPQGLQHT